MQGKHFFLTLEKQVNSPTSAVTVEVDNGKKMESCGESEAGGWFNKKEQMCFELRLAFPA